MVIGEYNRSVILTYVGVGCAVFAIWLLFKGQVTGAMMAFIGSGVCDLFDGVVARRMKRTEAQKAFGLEIDSLCDMINFATLPAVLFLLEIPVEGLNLLWALVYSLAAVTRLAHFNRLAKGQEGSSTHFIGLPVTYGALIFPLTYWVSRLLGADSYGLVLMVLVPVVSFLFVWNHPIPRPHKWAYIGFVVLAIVTVIGLGLML